MFLFPKFYSPEKKWKGWMVDLSFPSGGPFEEMGGKFIEEEGKLQDINKRENREGQSGSKGEQE